MANKMFNTYGRRNVNQTNFQNGNGFNGRFNSMNDFVNRFSEFKNSMTEDPDQKLQELLDSGQMTQQQYNMLYGLAKKIAGNV